MSVELDKLRAELTALDVSLIELIARRQEIVGAIGADKVASGKATRDFAREKVVVETARDTATKRGLDPDVAAELMELLIRASLTAQERDRVIAEGEGGGRTVMIIGGAGKMGQWFARFFSSQGFHVSISDPQPGSEYPNVEDWRPHINDFDIIVVATELGLAADILSELATLKPRGLVFDIGSLKTPLRASIEALRQAGVRVTSVHPMFGPDTRLLSGRHVITINVGHDQASEEAQHLFASTMVESIEMSLDEHDRLIAYVLGLSHAINIVFFTALAESAEAAPRLLQLSSTTFDAQMAVARQVASESPDLYFEIQHLNDFGLHPLAAMAEAGDRLLDAVQAGDKEAFKSMMDAGSSYLNSAGRRHDAG